LFRKRLVRSADAPLARVGGSLHVWVVAIAVAVLGGWSAFGFHREPRLDITTAEVTSGPIVGHIIATGTVEAVSSVQVGTEVSGTVATVRADDNSIVHAGDVLATLDPAAAAAALREAEAIAAEAGAALSQAEADEARLQTAANDAQTQLARADELAKRQLLPPSDLDAARIAVEQAEANLAAGRSQIGVAQAAVDQTAASVRQAQVNLDHTIIRSPIDGIVVGRNVDVGQTVAATFQSPVLFNLTSDFRRMQVQVAVDESEIGDVQVGAPVAFEVESYAKERFAGTVAEVRLQPVAEPTSGTTDAGTTPSGPTSSNTAAPTAIGYITIVDVSNPREKLRPGMTATVWIERSRIDGAVRIPNGALSFQPSPEALAAVKQAADASPVVGAADRTRRRAWRYDGTQFTPVDLRIGRSDEEWTQAIGNAVAPGDSLVTAVSITHGR